jgi:hypothetical protein
MKSIQLHLIEGFQRYQGHNKMHHGLQDLNETNKTKQTTLVDTHVPYIIRAVQIMYSYKSSLISK